MLTHRMKLECDLVLAGVALVHVAQRNLEGVVVARLESSVTVVCTS
jgi:hypothetical protein